jgi:hypothetical protein
MSWFGTIVAIHKCVDANQEEKMKTFTCNSEYLGRFGWAGEQYVTYLRDGGEPVVLGFGDTPQESEQNAHAEIEYAGIADDVSVDDLLTAQVDRKKS